MSTEDPTKAPDWLRDDREGVVPLDRGKAGRVAPRAPRRAAAPGPQPVPQFRTVRDEGWVEALREGAPEEELRSLRQDDIRPHATLDLHGKGSGPAVVSVERFVREQSRRGARVLRVVTGRGLHSDGGPIVRDAVIEALLTGPVAHHVIAVHTAPPTLGGAGALMVSVTPAPRG